MSKVPCGGFKLDENFLDINENDELSLVGGEGKAYQYVVTDGNGNVKWEDRLAYSETIEWDGNAEGKEIFGDVIVLLKKIPGITLEKVMQGTIDGTPISDIPFEFLAEGIYYFEDFYLVTQDNVFFNGVTFPYAGIYTSVRNQPFTLYIPLEAISAEFIPINYRVVFIDNGDESYSCYCSYGELKSFCIDKSVPILGSMYSGNYVLTLNYIYYNQVDEIITLGFCKGEMGGLRNLNYRQDGTIHAELS